MKNFLLLLSFLVCSLFLAQESVTKKYLDSDDLKIAKDFSKDYNVRILTKKYEIRNIGDPESKNNYDIEYKVQDDAGYALMLVNYDFRERDFTITLKSMTYHSKKSGAVTVIKSDNANEVISKYYETTKLLLLTLQSEYISPDLTKK